MAPLLTIVNARAGAEAAMTPRAFGEFAAAYLWTLAPMYLTERLANYFFLGHEPAYFFLISGWRLEVFIVSALVGPLLAGRVLRAFRPAALAGTAAVSTFFVLAYAACDPRVCYSAGPDGLEPLRFGLFLASVAVSGASFGAGARGSVDNAVAAGARFYALAWYPVVFTFAGANLLGPLSPWGAAAAIFLGGAGVTALAAQSLGGPRAAAAVAGAFFLCAGAGAGIATPYFGEVAVPFAGLAAAAALGSVAGAAAPRGRPAASLSRWAPIAGVVLVLLMTLVVIPDEVSGVVQSGPSATPSIGVPVYAGGYMDAPASHSLGAAVTVSFDGTNSSALQPGNFLAAGIGVHSPNCCVDGIDYAYRADLLLFRGGDEVVAASGWEACDDNAACGGHSWKVLLFSQETDLGAVGPGANGTLSSGWREMAVVGSNALDGGRAVNFSTFEAPAKEDPGFNTGMLQGFSWREQTAAYFYQFGVWSARPAGEGWRASFFCPSVLVGGGWSCIAHAGALQGGGSYWKVLWRWGEPYPGVRVASPSPGDAVFASATGGTSPGQGKLW